MKKIVDESASQKYIAVTCEGKVSYECLYAQMFCSNVYLGEGMGRVPDMGKV